MNGSKAQLLLNLGVKQPTLENLHTPIKVDLPALSGFDTF